LRVPVHTASAVILAVAMGLAASPADAGSNRVWVSGHGTDQAGCGAPTAACRSFQYAIDNVVNAGGEIDVLDPAGYGAVNINKPLAIVNDGVGTAGVQAVGSGVGASISLIGPGTVRLKGLAIDGLNGSGSTGILVFGGHVVIEDCVVRGFSQQGVDLLFGSIDVADTLVAENQYGLFILGQGTALAATLNHVMLVDNSSIGAEIQTQFTGSSVNVTISNSNLSNNGSAGVNDLGPDGPVVVEIDDSTLNSNGSYGVWAGPGATTHLTRSVLDENGVYGVNLANAVVNSSGDNHIEENGAAAVGGTGTTLVADTWQ
jgi:hypothetical protein